MTEPSATVGTASARIGMRPQPWGAYRRAIRIVCDRGVARADMEDDVHHFRLTITHANGVVRAVEGEAIRTPWSICPGALAELSALEGRRLGDLLSLAARDRAEQCMHLFDLILLAAKHAGKTGFERHYRIEGDYDQSPPQMRLWCNGSDILSWAVVNGHIQGSTFEGIALRNLGEAIANMPEQLAEAALILRRASLIAASRILDLDLFDDANAINPQAPAVCYARQPGRSANALRNRGSARDFYADDAWPLETTQTSL